MRRIIGCLAGTALATGGLLAVTSAPASAGAVPGVLFSSNVPGFVADAATVPAGICFVTIDAAGGAGGDNGGIPEGSGRA